MSFVIRLVRPEDAESIRAIYNEAVRTTTATLDTQERDLPTQLAWIEKHQGDPYPGFVAEDREGIILGCASLSPYNPKPGYRGTAENSVYVDPHAQGHGIGEALLQALLDDAPHREIRTIVALISADNLASLQLHRKLGFRTLGTLERVGRKFGRDVDVTILQRHTS
ncbi:MAG: GNAT family N-acetyltransferase [Armatimonadetes bacterium]|jgi:L-amino acid N-acyltransferase YncA|nr:GNAT family N-acetyltransferase [Armatimonadota bacterium]